MRKGWIVGIVALVIVAVAGAGGYYLFFQDKVQVNVEQAVQRLFANPPAPYTKASYGKLDVSLASRRLTIDNIVLERSAPPYQIKIERFEATGIDTDALQSVFDPARYKEGSSDQTFRKLADTVVLTKIDADSRERGRLTIDRFTAQGVQGHQFNVRPDPATFQAMNERERMFAVLDALKLDSAALDNVTSGGSQSPAGTVASIVVKDFSRQGVGSFTVEGLDFKDAKSGAHTSWKRMQVRDIPGDPWLDYAFTGKPPSDVLRLLALGGVSMAELKIESGNATDPTIRIASYEMGKVDRKRLDSFVLSGLEVVGPGGGATVGSIEIKGLNWEQVLPLVNQPDWIARLRDVSYGVDRFSVRDIGGVSMAEVGARLQEVLLTLHVDLASGKVDSVFNIERFELDAAKVKDPEIAGVLQSLGYDKLELSLQSSGTADDKAGTSNLDKFRIFGPQLGEMNLSFALSDLKRPPPSNKPPELFEALAPIMAARLQTLRLSWKDDGLTPRLMKFASDQQGMSVDQLRQGLIAQVKGASQQFAGVPAVAAALQAIVDYLTKPGTLTVELKPPNAPRFAELGPLFNFDAPPDVPKIFQVLGIKVSAN